MAQNKVVALATVGGLVLVGCLATMQKPSILVRRHQISDLELMQQSMKVYNGRQRATREGLQR
jgi:hypothetical protein